MKLQTCRNIGSTDPKLSSILSASNIESNEINEKATMLRELLMNVAGD
jgi:hypothetical protein